MSTLVILYTDNGKYLFSVELLPKSCTVPVIAVRERNSWLAMFTRWLSSTPGLLVMEAAAMNEDTWYKKIGHQTVCSNSLKKCEWYVSRMHFLRLKCWFLSLVYLTSSPPQKVENVDRFAERSKIFCWKQKRNFIGFQSKGSSRILRNLAEERILEDPSKPGRREDPRGSFESWQKRGSSRILRKLAEERILFHTCVFS